MVDRFTITSTDKKQIKGRSLPISVSHNDGFVTSAYRDRMGSLGSPSSPVLAAIRLTVMALSLLLIIPTQRLLLLLPPPIRDFAPKHFHRFSCWLFGLRLEVSGEPTRESQVIFVTNHSSYLDILVLGSRVKGVFISRSEVASWPIFGMMAKLQRSMFLERKSTASGRGNNAIIERMNMGDNLIMFAEATTTDGGRLAPFKSALMQAAMAGGENSEVKIQPITLTYTRLNGTVMGRSLRPLVAWFGDMTMFKHLFVMAGLGKITVELKFHPLLAAKDFKDRKELSRACRAFIEDGLVKSITGRE
ncbi:MAG: lysophospholipid acyltransferase family protein [Candidatus Pacebacteria bacterium]|nr:lysophospholipid acyltransferase family protein [Candidatus Paceibacterota bacterium]